MDDRLAISLSHPAYGVKRWGPDEVDPGDTPSGLTFSTSIPGGYKDCSHAVIRDPLAEHADQRLLADVRVYGAGNRTAWEGRHVQFPRGEWQVNPGAVGHAACLKDDTSFQMVYVDRDLGSWREPARNREVNLLLSNFAPRGFRIAPDVTQGLPALMLEIDGAWTNVLPISLADYDAGSGLRLASLYYDFTASQSGDNWQLFIQARDTDDQSGSLNQSSANLSAAAGSGYFTPATPARFWEMWHYFNAAGGAAGAAYQVVMRKLAAYGNHGLTRRGIDPGGFYVPDIVADIVTRAAPRLTYTRGVNGSIQDDTFIVPHCVFRGGNAGEQAIMDVTKYMLDWEWGVYDEHQFFYRRTDPARLVWEARISEGAKLTPEGEQLEDLWNGVVVLYRDPAGQERMVGPTGSGLESESASLVDKTATNPINAAGYARRWAQLQISEVTTLEGATRVGQLWLQEHSRQQFRGELELVGSVRHPTAGVSPAWAPRAGDYVRVPERPNDPPRRIIETRYAHDTRTNTLALDNALFRTEAILERMGLALVGVI